MPQSDESNASSGNAFSDLMIYRIKPTSLIDRNTHSVMESKLVQTDQVLMVDA